ncbi:MAG TPA: Na+/H+ antiporter subunit D [Thermoanaerobaculia bacterium]|nr:Na+/H+ antiporter subunit D [Thermoanaerobaculia bacterium]HQN07733.1 Na+/H+ antiporter subunit D [Thermoanaerobaculia bacterium]HQP86305.1 Na+/H+ antiporter subunit D [Thermoanaerobaculia bacterium]
MNTLLVLPLLVPLATAAATILLARSPRAVRTASFAGAAASLGAAVALLGATRDGTILVTQAGAWEAPFGISLVADRFAAAMVLVAALLLAAVVVSSIRGLDGARERAGYHPLLHVLSMGVSGAFLTGDLFNLYVWFEVMLMSSFVLVSLGGERAQLQGALKYVVLNLVSSALFLAGAGLLYGSIGTLNMAGAAVALRELPAQGLPSVVASLFLLAFGIKAAAFPLFFWLPASYHTPPMPVAALFAGLLTKVGVYALVRVLTLVFVRDTAFTGPLLLAVAALTMVTGVLGAMAQGDVRKILSFHIVSQIGYMLMGLGLGTRLALAGTVFYVLHHIVVKANLFLVAGAMRRAGGSFSLEKLGSLLARSPLLAAAFLVPAVSLAGLPPLSGFWAKYLLVRAGLEAGNGTIVAVSLAVSLLTLFSMTKIWNEAFWKPAPAGAGAAPAPLSAAERASLLGPVLVLGAITVAIGLGAGVLYRFADAAAAQLLDPELYVRAVLGARGGGT